MLDVRCLSEKQLSEISGIAVSTLQNDRATKRRISYVKVGRSVRYRLDDVITYMEAHRIGGGISTDRKGDL
jgi:hypothetical protein